MLRESKADTLEAWEEAEAKAQGSARLEVVQEGSKGLCSQALTIYQRDLDWKQ